MDHSNSGDKDEVNKRTFCIRFTIGGSSGRSDPRDTHHHHHQRSVSSFSVNRDEDEDQKEAENFRHEPIFGRQDARYCDHSSFTGQNETSQLYCRVNGARPSGDTKSTTTTSTSTATSAAAAAAAVAGNRGTKKSYKFIDPQSHKSALFINLGGASGSEARGCQPPGTSQARSEEGEEGETEGRNRANDKRLFISPDLNAAVDALSVASSSTSTVSSEAGNPDEAAAASPPHEPFDDANSVFELLEPTPEDSAHCYSPSQSPERQDDIMSHSCNFIHWMSATKRRASSTNPPGQSAKSATSASSDTFKDLTNSTTLSDGPGAAGPAVARRASSSDGLNQAMEPSTSNLLATAGRSASRDHLAISDSVETVRELDQTQTNRFIPYLSADARPPMRLLDIKIDSPLPPPPPPPHDLRDLHDDVLSPLVSVAAADHQHLHHHQPSISLSAIRQIDDLVLAEEECRQLEAEAHYWEQRVEEMERKQFAEDVPRTLVENIIKHRKELRDLDFQLYQHQLDSEESDRLSCEDKLSHVLNLYERDDLDESSASESNFQMGPAKVRLDARMCALNEHAGGLFGGHHQRLLGHHRENRFITDFNDLGGIGGGAGASGYSPKFVTPLKPGQENTADILSAVPPSSSLQRRQYLSKASIGTDSSEYSQLPSFDQHKHRILSRQHHRQRHQVYEQQHQQQQQQQQQHFVSHRVSRQQENHRQQHSRQQTFLRVDACAEASEFQEKLTLPTAAQQRMCPSPVRPNHFKSEFKPPRHAIGPDSSSTASSSTSPP